MHKLEEKKVYEGFKLFALFRSQSRLSSGIFKYARITPHNSGAGESPLSEYLLLLKSLS